MYKYFVAYLTTKSSSVSRIHRHIVHTSWWKARRWIDTGFVGENVWYKAQCLDWVLSQRDNSQKYQKKEEHDERWGWRWQLLHRFLLLLYPIQHVHYQWRQLWIAKRLGLQLEASIQTLHPSTWNTYSISVNRIVSLKMEHYKNTFM